MYNYTFRYLKLSEPTSNNYKRMHGQPMKRWKHLRKAYEDRHRRNKKAFGRMVEKISNIGEVFARTNVIFSDTIAAMVKLAEQAEAEKKLKGETNADSTYSENNTD